MRNTLLAALGYALLAVGATARSADAPLPEPASWSFPAVVESARTLSPRNVEGRRFNELGLAYTTAELDALKPDRLTVGELQQYADIVAHAYPDAVWKQLTMPCDQIPVRNSNPTAFANIAYIALHAVSLDTRKKAATCLSTLQDALRKTRP